MAITVRAARPQSRAHDSAACAEIYAPYVADSAVSFEAEPPTAEQMAERMARAIAWYVAEEDEQVVGYAYALPHRERAAYRWACDVSVYVAASAQRRGAGRLLYERLLADVLGAGYRMACAGVALPNSASVALHEEVGFERVGVYRDIGWKLGRWHDVLWLQRPIGPRGTPPVEPV